MKARFTGSIFALAAFIYPTTAQVASTPAAAIPAPHLATPIILPAVLHPERYDTRLTLSFDVANGIVAPVGPSRVRVPFGENVTRTARAPESGSLQWTKNGTPIPGATAVALTLPNTSRADRDHYTVTGDFGPNVFSPGVRLDVLQIGQVANVSARLQLAANGTPPIIGFVIDGTEPKSLLVRAVGPSLTDFGVTTAARPRFAIYGTSGSALVFIPFVLSRPMAEITASAGAFPLTAASGDFVDVYGLSPGDYTFHVHDTSGQGGLALFEIYEIAHPFARPVVMVPTPGPS